MPSPACHAPCKVCPPHRCSPANNAGLPQLRPARKGRARPAPCPYEPSSPSRALPLPSAQSSGSAPSKQRREPCRPTLQGDAGSCLKWRRPPALPLVQTPPWLLFPHQKRTTPNGLLGLLRAAIIPAKISRWRAPRQPVYRTTSCYPPG